MPSASPASPASMPVAATSTSAFAKTEPSNRPGPAPQQIAEGLLASFSTAMSPKGR
jgi:hypothetical protein